MPSLYTSVILRKYQVLLSLKYNTLPHLQLACPMWMLTFMWNGTSPCQMNPLVSIAALLLPHQPDHSPPPQYSTESAEFCTVQWHLLGIVHHQLPRFKKWGHVYIERELYNTKFFASSPYRATFYSVMTCLLLHQLGRAHVHPWPHWHLYYQGMDLHLKSSKGISLACIW